MTVDYRNLYNAVKPVGSALTRSSYSSKPVIAACTRFLSLKEEQFPEDLRSQFKDIIEACKSEADDKKVRSIEATIRGMTLDEVGALGGRISALWVELERRFKENKKRPR